MQHAKHTSALAGLKTTLLLLTSIICTPAFALHAWNFDFTPGVTDGSFQPANGSWIRIDLGGSTTFTGLNGTSRISPRGISGVAEVAGMETLDIDPASFFGGTLSFVFPAGNPGADITGSPMDGTLNPGDYSVDFSGFDILFNGASTGLSSIDFLALLSVVTAPDIMPDEQAPLTGSLDYFATATSGVLAGANIQLHLSNVPLPASVWLLLSGLSLLFVRAKRRS